jgi:hypothetical protein
MCRRGVDSDPVHSTRLSTPPDSDARGQIRVAAHTSRGARPREPLAAHVVHERGQHEPHDPRDIGTVQTLRHRARIEVGRHERQLHHDTEHVGENRHAVEAPVDAAVLAKERFDVVVAVADEVIVDEVPRATSI